VCHDHAGVGADHLGQVKLDELLVPREAVAPALWLAGDAITREVQRADAEP
jgi:hypothetical protein